VLFHAAAVRLGIGGGMTDDRVRGRRGAADFVSRRAERERLQKAIHESDILQIQLLDALIDMERLVRQAREIQLDVLGVEGVSGSRSVTLAERQLAAQRICDGIVELRASSLSVAVMVAHLESTADDLLAVLTVDTPVRAR
jgi:hypothetical protein